MRWLLIACCGALFAQEADLAARIHEAQSTGRYADAAKLYAALIAGGEDSPPIRSNYGLMLHLAGDDTKAVEQFRIALRGDSRLVAANLFLGVSLVELHRATEALPYLQRAVDGDPSAPAPRLAIGKCYVALRRFQDAHAVFEKLALSDPSSAEAWYGLGITARSLAQEQLSEAARQGSIGAAKAGTLLDEARNALGRAIDLDPASIQAHLILAESLSESGKLVDAVPEYQIVVRLAPRMAAGYLGLATAYWKTGAFDDALPPLLHALKLSPRDPEANAIYADVLIRDNDYAGARKRAALAVAGNPALPATRVVLARIALHDKQPRRAADELEKVANSDPDGSYHFLLWRAYKLLGQDAQAEKALAEYKRLRAAAAPK